MLAVAPALSLAAPAAAAPTTPQFSLTLIGSSTKVPFFHRYARVLPPGLPANFYWTGVHNSAGLFPGWVYDPLGYAPNGTAWIVSSAANGALQLPATFGVYSWYDIIGTLYYGGQIQFSFAHDVNESAQVVGEGNLAGANGGYGYWYNYTYLQHAYVTDMATGTSTDITPDVSTATGLAINDHGAVIGTFAFNDTEGHYLSGGAYLYDPAAGGRTTIASAKFPYVLAPKILNESDLVAGTYVDARKRTRGFAYVPGAAPLMADIGTEKVNAADSAMPLDINATGDIVGYDWVKADGPPDFGVYWQRTGAATWKPYFLANLVDGGNGPQFTAAIAINGHGDVIAVAPSGTYLLTRK